MADNSKFIQTQTFKLAGGGISLSDTSISLQSFKFPPATGSAPITMAHLGTICTATIEPGAAKEEIISFTGVTQNGDGSATLTGVTRGLKFGDTAGDYGQDLSLRKSHAGNTTFVITNNPQFYNKFAAKDNDEVITGDWQVPAPASGPSVVNKDYVDDAIGGGVGTATDTTFGTVKGTKNQGSKPKVISALVREQATPNKTLKVESLRQTFIDKIVSYAGGNTPNFIDPAMGGDLAFALTPSNGETITITVDGTACVFTAVTTIGATPGNFLIGASAATARANFAALVNNPTVTNANQVAFTGAQLTAIQKLSATDDLALNAFVRVTNPATASFTVTETMAGAGNIWTVNSTKNRYDLVVVDDAGALQIRKGVEAVSPSVPTPTNKDLVLALIFNQVGMSTVRDTFVPGQGYIVELYNPSIYRTDLADTAALSAAVAGALKASFTAGENIAINDAVQISQYTQPLGRILYDNKSSVAVSNQTNPSFSFTVGSGSNRLLLVAVTSLAGSDTVSAVTYNGVSMTRVQLAISSSSYITLWKLVAPATGSNTVQITGTAIYGYGAQSYSNVDQATNVEVINTVTVSGSPQNLNTTPLSNCAMLFGLVGGNGLGGSDSGSTISFGGVTCNNLNKNSTGTGLVMMGDSGHINVPAAITGAYTLNFSGGGSYIYAIIQVAIKPANPVVTGLVKTNASTTVNGTLVNFIGFADAAITAGVVGSVRLLGIMGGFTGLTIGSTYYLSNTSGLLSTSAGTNSKKVGIAISTTEILIKNDNV